MDSRPNFCNWLREEEQYGNILLPSTAFIALFVAGRVSMYGKQTFVMIIQVCARRCGFDDLQVRLREHSKV